MTAGDEPLRLLGENFAAALAASGEESLARTFSSDGRRLFVTVRGDRVRVYDAVSAILLKELPGTFQIPPVSRDGRFLALQNADDTVGLYDYNTFSLMRTIPGSHPVFHLDLLVVHGPRNTEQSSSAIAYRLQPFAKRWERRRIELYRDQGANATSWRVGGLEGIGYSVFDVETGETLATWRSSGYGCGYQWAWESGTLAFLEGDLLTLWRKTHGAMTHSSLCAGTLKPIFSADRTRFIGLDSIWELRTQRRVTRLELPGMDSAVVGFSQDERLVIGSYSISECGDPQLIAWSAATGRVVWHKCQSDVGKFTGQVGWYLAKDAYGAETRSSQFRQPCSNT